MLTATQLREIVRGCPKADVYAANISETAAEFEINTASRLAAFIAQLAWETAHFRTLVEYASGDDYEGRRDLGNTEPGDGRRFKGRGAIQLTGRANYAKYGEILGVDLIADPERAKDPDLAFRIAGLYWSDHNCNAMMDARDFDQVTKAINGACTEGAPSYQARRRAYYIAAMEVLCGSSSLA